jgi:hypothetical protein
MVTGPIEVRIDAAYGIKVWINLYPEKGRVTDWGYAAFLSRLWMTASY